MSAVSMMPHRAVRAHKYHAVKKGGNEKWHKIAPGIKGMGDRLIFVDQQLICDGARGFQSELAAFGIAAKLMPEWRGKRRDFPGMAAIDDCVLVIEDWRQKKR